MPPKEQFEALLLEPVNHVRMQAGLSPIKTLWEAWETFPAFSNSIRELDPLASQAPQTFRYFGPMAEVVAPSDWKSPWSSTDDRPLILVSFSTGPYWDQTSRISRTLEALSHIDCRVLVTAGPVEIDPMLVPGNAIVVGRVPHDEIMPKTALTVTHAGHGTVIASLKYGVPLLCLANPVADQPILASQVKTLGCGLSLNGENATPAEIKEAVDRLLSDPFYAAKAHLMAATISQSPGVSSAVAELEALFDRKPSISNAAE